MKLEPHIINDCLKTQHWGDIPRRSSYGMPAPSPRGIVDYLLMAFYLHLWTRQCESGRSNFSELPRRVYKSPLRTHFELASPEEVYDFLEAIYSLG